MASSPVAVGETGDDGQQGDENHHAGSDDHVPSLLLLRLLEVPPLQVAELTALAHVAGHTAATSHTSVSRR